MEDWRRAKPLISYKYSHKLFTNLPNHPNPRSRRGLKPNDPAYHNNTQTKQTQTPLNEIGYEFDRALYTKHLGRSGSGQHCSRERRVTTSANSARQNFRVYLPTIIDTIPRWVSKTCFLIGVQSSMFRFHFKVSRDTSICSNSDYNYCNRL